MGHSGAVVARVGHERLRDGRLMRGVDRDPSVADQIRVGHELSADMDSYDKSTKWRSRSSTIVRKFGVAGTSPYRRLALNGSGRADVTRAGRGCRGRAGAPLRGSDGRADSHTPLCRCPDRSKGLGASRIASCPQCAKCPGFTRVCSEACQDRTLMHIQLRHPFGLSRINHPLDKPSG